MHDHVLLDTETFLLVRRKRYAIVELKEAHDVLSTSYVNGGIQHNLGFLANHQSCEAASHDERFNLILGMGQAAYHSYACNEAGLAPDRTALMGTAANMQYLAIAHAGVDAYKVVAIVTAGVSGNAGRSGEKAGWTEEIRHEDSWQSSGTINIILVSSVPLSPGALARTATSICEAKTSVLMELGIVSKKSWEMATGTGTDQYIIAAPRYQGKGLTWTGTHSTMGELIGKSVQEALREALRWQNGLEPSYCRQLYRILGRFGCSETWFVQELEKAVVAGEISQSFGDLCKKITMRLCMTQF